MFSTSAKIYAIPRTVRVGRKDRPEAKLPEELRRAGYGEKDGSSSAGQLSAC